VGCRQVSEGPPSADRQPVLRIAGLSKHFGDQQVLSDVDLVLRSGEVCALIGQNGSGKSTLIKILAGYHAADPGAELWFRGRRVSLNDRSAEWRRCVRFIHQDLGLIAAMSVLDNLAFGIGYRTDRVGRIRWREQRRRAAVALAPLALDDLDLDARVGSLGQVERTLVAVARALLDWEGDDGVLVLDEPTAALSAPEVARLFDALRPLTERGVAILFVSHRFEESFRIADRVVVLRDGRVVADRPIAGLDEHALLTLMIGGEPETMYPQIAPPSGDDALVVRRLSSGRLRELSFSLRGGEIAGVAGLAGSGREDVPGLLFGDLPARHGEIIIGGRRLQRPSPQAAIRLGVALVPSDRVHRSVFADATIRENITLPNLRPLWRRFRIDRGAERREVGEWLGRVRLTPPDPDGSMSALSGGNQQKGVIARWLRINPRVLLLDEPTQGVDVASKSAIFGLIADAAAAGAAVLVCSSEAKDLAAICDRVLVLNHGAIAADLRGEALIEDRIVAAMLAGSAHRDQEVRTAVEVSG
jgi:ribose transport system ATP-binding protein